MGNVCTPCGRNPPQRPNSHRASSLGESIGPMERKEITPEDIEIQMRKMKEYHLKRLRTGLEKDLHTFILDNLLMCIQFFDNFEKSVDKANKFKRDYEREMTELLANDPLQGMIIGERRIKLLTGMSDVLAQNYIYVGKNQNGPAPEEIDSVYAGMPYKDTFASEGILPLEFTMTWDNLEVYDSSQYDHVKEYSHPKGVPPIARFCMEKPDKKMNFPPTFLRLRCVDEPKPILKGFQIPPELINPALSEEEIVYDEVGDSESDQANSAPTSDDEKSIGLENLVETLRKHEGPSTSRSHYNHHHTAPPLTRPKLTKLQLMSQNDHYPSVVIHEATPPVNELPNGFMYQRSSSERILSSNNRLGPPSRDSPGKETSSGYDTTSTLSRASTMMSSMMRDKWQRLHVKRLMEFGRKSRKEDISDEGRYDPIPENCYYEIKIGFTIDEHPTEDQDEEEDEDDDDSMISDADSDLVQIVGFNSQRKKKTHDDAEEKEEKRHYLNSLQFSSNVCSEFHYIGPKLSIPPESLASGVVLETTILCPIPYSFPKDREDEVVATVGSYYVPYAFTPVLHSKTWPGRLYEQFNAQVFSNTTKGNLLGESWPSRSQMHELEMLGCNLIPLGYRTMEHFNTEHILEWELNFLDCEANLLNSFRSSHWRAYIFAAILYRAFIAPLGPHGIGLEHIRNTLYFMCHENFSGWNDEQPGLHLKILLEHVYNCMGRKHMPSFFVRARNLLQNIPEHNLRYVQGHLKRIQENPIIYCIYSFGNLMNVPQTKECNPFPNLKHLYEILTLDDTDLQRTQISLPLREREDQEEQERQEQLRENAKRRKKRNDTQRPRLLLNGDQDFDPNSSQRPPKKDKFQELLREKNRRRMEKKEKEELQKKEREEQRLKDNPELRVPEPEKRKSIDLRKTPKFPKSFSPVRVVLAMQFFIEQFLKMAKRATDLKCYDLATMYIVQVDNLYEILHDSKYKEAISMSSIKDEDLSRYRQEVLRLDAVIGKDKHQYILTRLGLPTQQSFPPSVPTTPVSPHVPSFASNWDLRKKLPTPPSSVKDAQTSAKILTKPNMFNTLNSLPSSALSDEPRPTSRSSTALSVVEEVFIDENRRSPRRQESIKFVSPGVSRATSVASATPPRSRKTPSRTMSRESLYSIKLFEDENDSESTDL